MKTEVITVHPEFPEKEKIAYCAKIIRQGGLVIFPTETVYGIAADYNNKKAMERLREVKKRSADKPFSVIISQKGLISNYTSSTEPLVYKLVDAFWPGPLTVVVPGKEGMEKTIGVRMPDSAIALALAQESKCVVAAPSANFEGKTPPITYEEALKDLDGLVDVAIDGGMARIGQGSTVVDVTENNPKVLREGAISKEDIERVARKKTVIFVCTGNSCRSVMAEYLLKDLMHKKDNLEIFSAGTNVFIQSMASAETLSLLRRRGIDASSHRAQPINSILLKKADLILVMTRLHRMQVLERTPSVEKRVYLLREFANNSASFEVDLDIPDPIGRSAFEYEECANIIQEAIVKLEKLL